MFPIKLCIIQYIHFRSSQLLSQGDFWGTRLNLLKALKVV